MNYSNREDPDSGIEGVTYNATNGDIYFLNEKEPGALIVANSSFDVTNEYPLTYAEDYSASYYVNETGNLWLGSDNSSTVYKCNIDGSVIETFPMTANGSSLDKLEGIAIDYANQLLYVVTDAGQELFVYKIDTPLLNIKEYEEAIVSVFPVPAKDLITISLKKPDTLDQIIFYNLLGQRVKTIKPKGNTVDISDLDSGLYFLYIATEDNYYSKTILIQ